MPQRGKRRVKTSVRAECSPESTASTNGDRAVGAGDADVDVETEGVVAPDDVAKDLVVPPVVRRVDDALVLPAAPRMRTRAAEREPDVAGQPVQLAASLLHRGRGLGEGLAASGSHLD